MIVIKIGQAKVVATDKVRNPDAIYDKEMNLKSQVSNICKSIFIMLKSITNQKLSGQKSACKYYSTWFFHI